ncbi:MAG TPA: asparagine synthase (glutamine-hydrolyzing) [Terriglobales bacterium]|nr:asparagine synthase (glutamine-hydrolyzing) [Terriglobales bacterium]
MCGIFGIVGRGASVDAQLLDQATQSLAHRGPDDSGTVIIREQGPETLEVGLGNRRLAILDLSPLGHQPMRDPETGNWIVYNGEIYNFREVRKKLEDDGVQFVSNSDTEVLLKAYARWKERCLEEFRGMFAFAIWDTQSRRLFLARDPMGVKPLYYCTSGQYFLFASETRALLRTGLVPCRLDRAGLFSYLSFGSAYDPITLIEGICALRPGHYLTWENGRAYEQMYWDLRPPLAEMRNGGKRTGSAERERLQTDLSTALDEAVRMQTVSDVPVGVFLSGGIDSSAVAGLLRRSGADVNTFSIVFREADYSEAEHSRAVAREFGTNHHEILVSQHDALEAIPSALRAMDQPTIDGLNTYLIARQTRAAGIKVALSGLGGDELFAGYSSFRDVPRMQRIARLCAAFPGILRDWAARLLGAVTPENDRNRKLAALAASGGIDPYVLSRTLFIPETRSSLLRKHNFEPASLALSDTLDHARGLDPINRVSYLESRCYMLNTLLRDADVMSMAHGLEMRVPLIDHVLARKLLALPGDWKLNGSTPKPLLVDAVQGALPERIVHRKKRGFTLPFEHWLRDELRPEVEHGLQSLAEGPLASVFDLSAVRTVWNNFGSGKTSWSRPWALYVLQKWCEVNSLQA